MLSLKGALVKLVIFVKFPRLLRSEYLKISSSQRQGHRLVNENYKYFQIFRQGLIRSGKKCCAGKAVL